MHKCNQPDKGSNGAINAKSPQVWSHFQRLKLRMLIPRCQCLRLQTEKERHYQLQVLVWAEGT